MIIVLITTLYSVYVLTYWIESIYYNYVLYESNNMFDLGVLHAVTRHVVADHLSSDYIIIL